MGDIGKVGNRFRTSFKDRLKMMAQARGHRPLQQAVDIAEESLRLEEKAKQTEDPSGEPDPPTTSDACQNGHRARALLTRAGAILTDTTGEVKEHVLKQAEKAEEIVDEARKKKDKENLQEYGDENPGVAKVLIDAADAARKPTSRRGFLFGGFRHVTQEIKENAPEIGEALLPFPFNLLAKAFRWLRH